MPYYVFKMSSPEGMGLVKNLELIMTLNHFVRQKTLRKSSVPGSTSTIQVLLK